MKTVLQELMDGFDNYQLESQNDSITIEKLKEVITEVYLEKEKDQIINAYTDGRMSVITKEIISYKEYYNSKFSDNAM